MAEVGGQWPEHLIKIDPGSRLVQSGFMAMGKKGEQQDELFVPYSQMRSAGHPFYRALDGVLREHGFDRYAEEVCARFYHPVMGRPGLAPGNYFRSLLVGYFEGIESERGIAWRLADSLSLRDFLGLPTDKAPPDHSTISRTRRLIGSYPIHRRRSMAACSMKAAIVLGADECPVREVRLVQGVGDATPFPDESAPAGVGRGGVVLPSRRQ